MVQRTIFICTVLISVINVTFGQGLMQTDQNFSGFIPLTKHQNKISELRNFSLQHDTLKDMNVKFAGSKKSPGLAFIYSLFVPGVGQLYARRFDVGKYYMISEASLWLGFASFTIYGNWLLNDAHRFASIHAGVNTNGKDDNYFVNISNFDNIYQYNDEQLRNGRYDNLYDESKYYFYWDNITDRKQYRVDQLAGDRVLTDRLFFVGAILANHIISAISAIILTNSYNDQLSGSKGGFVINADVMKNGLKVDGLQVKLTKWF